MPRRTRTQNSLSPEPQGLAGLSLALLSACFAVLPLAGAAHAEEPPSVSASIVVDEDLQKARHAFLLGTELARKGRWLDALAAFQSSARLRPHPVTTYNIAYSERVLARYVRASKFFEQALAEHESGKFGAMTDAMLVKTREYLAEANARVGVLEVRLGARGSAIAIDGRPLEPAAGAGTRRVFRSGTREPGPPEVVDARAFDVLADPGTHVLVVRTPQHHVRTWTREVKPGARLAVDLAAPVRVTRQTEPDRLNPMWMWTAYGVGATGLLTGASFGVAALVLQSDLEKRCGESGCPKATQPDLDRAWRFATVSNVGFAVGAAGVAAGTLLFLLGDAAPPERSRPHAALVTPYVSVGILGARGMF